LKAAKKKAVSTAMNAMRRKEEEQNKMKHGGKYKKGGRKPGALQDKAAKALKNRASNQKFKSEVNKLRADRMSEKASNTKSKVVRKLREEVATKRADQARGNEAKAERSTKAAKFASKRGEMARNRAKNKAAKAEIRAKYENGGRKTGDPKKKKKYQTLVDPKSKKYPAIAAAESRIRKMREDDKSTRGKAALSSRDAGWAQESVESGYSYRKNNDDGRRLAPRTLTPKGPLNKGSRFDTVKERKDPNFRKQRYTVPNESKDKSLKGRTSGKSGNVGKGVQIKKKRRR